MGKLKAKNKESILNFWAVVGIMKKGKKAKKTKFVKSVLLKPLKKIHCAIMEIFFLPGAQYVQNMLW